MNERFNARLYAQGAIMAISELYPGEKDYYETKQQAVTAVKKLMAFSGQAIGGEVIKLDSTGHYKTVAQIYL